MGLCGTSDPSDEQPLYMISPKYTSDDESTDPAGNRSEELNNASDSIKGTRNTVIGCVVVLVATVVYVLSIACAQMLDKSVPHSELNGLRYIVQWIIVTPFVIGLNKCDVTVAKSDIKWVSLACFLNTCNNYGMYGMVYYLPLGTSAGITESLILIVTYSINSIIQKLFKWYEFVAMSICIAGVFLVTQPRFLFNIPDDIPVNNTSVYLNYSSLPVCRHITLNISHYSVEYTNQSADMVQVTSSQREETIGYLLVGLVCVSFVATMFTVKHKLAHVSVWTLSFWISVFGTVSSFTIMAISEEPYFPQTPPCITILFGHLLGATLGTILALKAYQMLDLFIVALIYTLEIIGGFVLQFTLLSSILPGKSNNIAISGAAVIFLGNALVPIYHIIYRCRKTGAS